MRSLGLNSAVFGGILLVAFAAIEWNKGPTSQIAAALKASTDSSVTSIAPNETGSSKVKPVADDVAEAGENGSHAAPCISHTCS
jgi:hypothetical protein